VINQEEHLFLRLEFTQRVYLYMSQNISWYENRLKNISVNFIHISS
jgi:hypothetical protein